MSENTPTAKLDTQSKPEAEAVIDEDEAQVQEEIPVPENPEQFSWDRDTWKFIDTFFNQPGILVENQITSFNRFIDSDIPEIIRHHNPIIVGREWKAGDGVNKGGYEKMYKIEFGNIYISQPLILERNESIKILLPSEARLRDLTYAAPLFVDVTHSLIVDGKVEQTKLEPKIPLAKIPIMLHSKYCYLNSESRGNKTLPEMGEGEFDLGGYFIINGSEKVIIGQERPAENKVLCFPEKTSTRYIANTEVKSTLDQRLYPIKIIKVNMTKEPKEKFRSKKDPSGSLVGQTLQVSIPSIKDDIPLFVVFRALGMVSDREIFQSIMYDLENPDPNFVNLLLPSSEEALRLKDPSDKSITIAIRTQEDALRYLGHRDILKYNTDFLDKEDKSQNRVLRDKYIRDLLDRELFPHMGRNNRKKAFFLGYMTRRLLESVLGIRQYDDRDHYSNKRINLSGALMARLFSSGFTRLVRKLKTEVQRFLSPDKDKTELKGVLPGLRKAVQSCSIETSLKYALSTGNWATNKSGANGTTNKGVAQVLQRMSYIQMVSHLRRIQSPLERAGSKLVPPRKLHETQVGLICPNETPEGGQVGVVKNLAFMAHITEHTHPIYVHVILRELGVRPLEEISGEELYGATKVFVNGHFFGIIREGLTEEIYQNLRLLKRNSVGLRPHHSIRWYIEAKELIIQTDGGRLCRPLYVVVPDPEKGNIPVLLAQKVWNQIQDRLGEGSPDPLRWYQLMSGDWRENAGRTTGEICNRDGYLRAEESALIEYLDTDEMECSMVAMNNNVLRNNRGIWSIRVVQGGSGYRVGDPVRFQNAPGDMGQDARAQVSQVGPAGEVKIVQILDKGAYYLTAPKARVLRGVGTTDLKEGVVEEDEAVLEVVLPNQYLPYTHCEIHPTMWLGVVSQASPFSEHNPSPRNCYQASMGKQALGIYATNYNQRMDTMAHVLCYPQNPLVATRTMKYTNMDKMPSGQQAIVAIMTYTGFNQEDSVIMNKSAIDRGLFTSLAFKTYKDKEEKHKAVGGGGSREQFGIPERELTKDMKGKPEAYRALDPDTGVARVGSYVKGGDIIIGKYLDLSLTEREETSKEYKDVSKELKHNDDGYVDLVLDGRQVVKGKPIVNYNADGEQIAKVRINQLRRPEIADKFASRHAQKGTCGMLYRQEDMPFTENGMVPDIIMNPHAIPSRMTVGQLLECLCGKVGALSGKIMDATPFTAFDREAVHRELESYGFHRSCDEVMYNGQTGDQFKTTIFIGPTYYQRLKHMVMDKIHSRETGPVQLMTRQPQEGRARDGGLRLGEMERDVLIAHGCSQFLKERLMESSDLFRVFVSKEHQAIVVANPERNLFMYNGKHLTRDQVVEVQLPYAMKLLLHEMAAMGIDTRLETE